MRRRQPFIAAFFVGTSLFAACVESPYSQGATTHSEPSGAPATPSAPTRTGARPEFVRVQDVSAGADVVVKQARDAITDTRTLVVYVGATWCEPCKRFHEAVERGELDGPLANVRFLEFDADEHGEALDAAGYGGRLIPRFVKPDAAGRGADVRIEGGVKGDNAVAHIMARLGPLLAS